MLQIFDKKTYTVARPDPYSLKKVSWNMDDVSNESVVLPVNSRQLLLSLCVRVMFAVNDFHLLEDCALARFTSTQKKEFDFLRLLTSLASHGLFNFLRLFPLLGVLRTPCALTAPHLKIFCEKTSFSVDADLDYQQSAAQGRECIMVNGQSP